MARSFHDPVWGLLLPQDKSLSGKIELRKDDYSFGTEQYCDYQIILPPDQSHPYFKDYSPVHFRLQRESTESETFVYIHDMSEHGTYVNGKKLGRKNKRILEPDMEISLVNSENKAFIFIVENPEDLVEIPDVIKNSYIISKTLGRGAFGKVRLLFAQDGSAKVAMKCVEKYGNLDDSFVTKESKIMVKLKHPCIIEVIEVHNTPSCLYIIMELAEAGTLQSRLRQHGRLGEKNTRLIIYQILLAVQYLHGQGITHRDLKPDNILLASRSHETLIKVTDFGVSKVIDQHTIMKTLAGTPSYIAPEIWKGQMLSGQYSSAVDVWSIGIMLYQCIIGDLPIKASGRGEYRHDLFETYKIQTRFDNSLWTEMPFAEDLGRKLLKVEAVERIKVDDAIGHVWFQSGNVRKRIQELTGLPMEGNSGTIPAGPSKHDDDTDEASDEDESDTSDENDELTIRPAPPSPAGPSVAPKPQVRLSSNMKQPVQQFKVQQPQPVPVRTPKKPSPTQVTPKQDVPSQVTPKQAVPAQMTPKQALPVQATPRQDTTPKHSAPQETKPVKSIQQQPPSVKPKLQVSKHVKVEAARPGPEGEPATPATPNPEAKVKNKLLLKEKFMKDSARIAQVLDEPKKEPEMTIEEVLVGMEIHQNQPEVIFKCLNQLKRWLQSQNLQNHREALNGVLLSMKSHPGDVTIQFLGSSSIYLFLKSKYRPNLTENNKRAMISAMLDCMGIHVNDAKLIQRCCHGLHQFDIPHDMTQDFGRVVQQVVKLSEHSYDPKFVELQCIHLAVDLLNRLSCPQSNRKKPFEANLGALSGHAMTEIIKERLQHQNCDIVMERAWSVLWNVTYDTPENCIRFMTAGGFDIITDCMKVFREKADLFKNMMGLMCNMVEVKYVREQLLKSDDREVISCISDKMNSKEISISYGACSVMARIVADGAAAWRISTPTHSYICDQLGQTIACWDMNKETAVYRGFNIQPILRLLSGTSSPEAQYWAAWTLCNLVLNNPDKYCPLLETDGGLRKLDALLRSNIGDVIKDVAKHTMVLYTSYKDSSLS